MHEPEPLTMRQCVVLFFALAIGLTASPFIVAAIG